MSETMPNEPTAHQLFRDRPFFSTADEPAFFASDGTVLPAFDWKLLKRECIARDSSLDVYLAELESYVASLPEDATRVQFSRQLDDFWAESIANGLASVRFG